MFTKTILKLALALSLLVVFLVAAYQTTVGTALASPAPQTEEAICNSNIQAGKVMVTLTGSMTLTPISFAKEFCQAPIVIVSGGENVKLVQVGVVTTQVAWLLVYGPQGQTVTLHWQAIEATQ